MDGVVRRFHQVQSAGGVPYYLEVHDEIYPAGSPDGPSTPPGECVGAYIKGKSNGRRRLCQQAHFCCFCWERRARLNSLKTAVLHVAQPNIRRLHIPLGRGRGGPEQMRHALTRVSRCLRGAGFVRQALWLQPFSLNIAHGPRPHISGVVSGIDADVDVFDPTRPRGLGMVLRKYLLERDGGHWPIQIQAKGGFHPHSRRHVTELLNAGYEAGQRSFNARRLHAGLVRSSRGYKVHLTDVRPGSRPSQVRCVTDDDECVVLSRKQVGELARLAEQWRTLCGRPVLTRGVRLPQDLQDLVLERTSWRGYFRLPTDHEIRSRYGMV